MFTITPEAKKELDAYFEGKDKATIRLFLMPGGCSGPRLALALDPAKPDDFTFDLDGYDFCINQELKDQVEGVNIAFNDQMGFDLQPEKPLPAPAGGGCGGCCGGCGSN